MLSENVYIDQSPVTNLMYLKFLDKVGNYWNYNLHDSINKLLPNKISNKLLTQNIDEQGSKKLKEKLQLPVYENVEEYVGSHTYLRSPLHNEAPVLFVNKEQANLYCLWRADMVNIMLNKKATHPKEAEYVTYRLATYLEMQRAVEFFEKKEKINYVQEVVPTKMKAKKEGLIFFKLAEITSEDAAYEYSANWQNKSSDIKSANNYTTFRCICETSKKQQQF